MFSHLLAPVEIATGGLAAALPRLGAEIERLFGVTCDVQVGSPLPALSEEQSMHLYRIAQEASRNAVEHGQARQVRIRLHTLPDGDGSLQLAIRNDGKPWGPEPGPGRGLGLRIMHYRASVLGGALSLQAAPDGQPEVVCHIPVPNPQLQSNTP
jgi:signal transduction histidine kinase